MKKLFFALASLISSLSLAGTKAYFHYDLHHNIYQPTLISSVDSISAIQSNSTAVDIKDVEGVIEEGKIKGRYALSLSKSESRMGHDKHFSYRFNFDDNRRRRLHSPDVSAGNSNSRGDNRVYLHTW